MQFNEILLKSIDGAISEVLSDKVLTSLYQHLADRYDVTRDEIPYRLETVYTSLNEIFGFQASRTLERQIAKRLRSLQHRFPRHPRMHPPNVRATG